jgi:hypothetical protein
VKAAITTLPSFADRLALGCRSVSVGSRVIRLIQRGIHEKAMSAEATAGSGGGAAAAGASGGEAAVEWATLEEGKAKVLHRPGEAFYNPAQVQNRDLSVAVLREFGKLLEKEKAEKVAAGKSKPNDFHANAHKGLRILEGLSATGLRAVRYAKEIDCIDKVRESTVTASFPLVTQ